MHKEASAIQPTDCWPLGGACRPRCRCWLARMSLTGSFPPSPFRSRLRSGLVQKLRVVTSFLRTFHCLGRPIASVCHPWPAALRTVFRAVDPSTVLRNRRLILPSARSRPRLSFRRGHTPSVPHGDPLFWNLMKAVSSVDGLRDSSLDAAAHARRTSRLSALVRCNSHLCRGSCYIDMVKATVMGHITKASRFLGYSIYQYSRRVSESAKILCRKMFGGNISTNELDSHSRDRPRSARCRRTPSGGSREWPPTTVACRPRTATMCASKGFCPRGCRGWNCLVEGAGGPFAVQSGTAPATEVVQGGVRAPYPPAASVGRRAALLATGPAAVACRSRAPVVDGSLPRIRCRSRRWRSSCRCRPSSPPRWHQKTIPAGSRHSRSSRGALKKGMTGPIKPDDHVGDGARGPSSRADTQRPATNATATAAWPAWRPPWRRAPPRRHPPMWGVSSTCPTRVPGAPVHPSCRTPGMIAGPPRGPE